MKKPSKEFVLRDGRKGLKPLKVEIWPDGDVVLEQGSGTLRDAIQISGAQVKKLIKSLAGE